MSRHKQIYRNFYRKTLWVLLFISMVLLYFLVVLPWFNKKSITTVATQQSQYVIPTTTTEVINPPLISFTEESVKRGLTFVQENGASGDKLLPETMGSGIAVIDYDNDGDLDLFFTNSNSLDENQPINNSSKLFQNDGTGQFKDVTEQAGLAINIYATGVAVGDVNQDGWDDLLVTALGDNWLFINQQGQTFSKHPKPLNCGNNEWSTSAGFFDYDKDGDEDLLFLNYVQWNKALDFAVNYQMDGIGKAFGPPSNFTSTAPCLLRNDEGQFIDQSEQAGFAGSNQPPQSKGLGLLLVDLNQDSWLDVLVANDTTANQVYLNNKNGGFEEKGSAMGLAYDLSGKSTGAMGMDVMYSNHAEKMSVAIGNFANESTSFYVNQGDGLFTDESMLSGIGAASRLRLTFGVFFFDYDLDGYFDFFQTNGHVENLINEVQNSQTYEQLNQLFWNCGDLCSQQFLPVKEAGDLITDSVVGRSAVYADIDADGDLDVIISQVAKPARVYINQNQLNNNWLTVKLLSLEHASMIGSLITVETEGNKQKLIYGRTKSYQSQTQLWQTIGLGQSTQAKLTITTPYGDTKTIEVSAQELNQVVTVEF